MWQYSHFEWRLQGDLITYGSGGGGGGGGGNVLLGRRKVITASLEHKLEQKSARFAQQVTMHRRVSSSLTATLAQAKLPPPRILSVQ